MEEGRCAFMSPTRKLRAGLADGAGVVLAADLDIVAVWAIGVPGDVSAADDFSQKRENAPRQRNPAASVLL